MPYQVSNQRDMRASHRERVMSHMNKSYHMCITSPGLRGDKRVMQHIVNDFRVYLMIHMPYQESFQRDMTGDKRVMQHIVNDFHSHATVLQHAQHET